MTKSSQHDLNKLFEIVDDIRRRIPDSRLQADILWQRVLACTDSRRVPRILGATAAAGTVIADIKALHGQWLATARQAMAAILAEGDSAAPLDTDILRHLYPLAKADAAKQPALLGFCHRLAPDLLEPDLAKEFRRIASLADGCISDRLLAARRIRHLGLGLSDNPETLVLLAPLVPLATSLLYDENTSVWRAGASAFGSLAARDEVWNLLEIHLRRDDLDKSKKDEKGNIHRQRHAFAALGTAIRIPVRRDAVLRYAHSLFQGEDETRKAFNKRVVREKLDNIWILASFVYALPDMQQFAPESGMMFFTRLAGIPLSKDGKQFSLSSDEQKSAILGNLAVVAGEILDQVAKAASADEHPQWVNRVREWVESDGVKAHFEGDLPTDPFNRCEALVRRHSVWQPLLRRCYDRPESTRSPDQELSAGLDAVTTAGEAVHTAFVAGNPYPDSRNRFSTHPCVDRLADLRYAVQRVFSDGTLMASLEEDGGLRQRRQLAGRFDQILAGCRELLLSVMEHAASKLPSSADPIHRALNHGVQASCILMLGDLYDAMRDRHEYGNVFDLVLPFVSSDRGQLVHKYVAATIARCMELTWRQTADSDARVSAIRAMIGKLREAEWSGAVQKETREFIKDRKLFECVDTQCGTPRLRELTTVAGIFSETGPPSNNMPRLAANICSAWNRLAGKNPLPDDVNQVVESLVNIPLSEEVRHQFRDYWIEKSEFSDDNRKILQEALLLATTQMFERVLEPIGMTRGAAHLAEIFCAPVFAFDHTENALYRLFEGIFGAWLSALHAPQSKQTGKLGEHEASNDKLAEDRGILIRCHPSDLLPRNWQGNALYSGIEFDEDTKWMLNYPDANLMEIRFSGTPSSIPAPYVLLVGLLTALVQEPGFKCRRFFIRHQPRLPSEPHHIDIEPFGNEGWILDDDNPLIEGKLPFSQEPQKVGFWLHAIDRLICPAGQSWCIVRDQKSGQCRLQIEYDGRLTQGT